jgi:hypothetical protein
MFDASIDFETDLPIEWQGNPSRIGGRFTVLPQVGAFTVLPTQSVPITISVLVHKQGSATDEAGWTTLVFPASVAQATHNNQLTFTVQLTPPQASLPQISGHVFEVEVVVTGASRTIRKTKVLNPAP